MDFSFTVRLDNFEISFSVSSSCSVNTPIPYIIDFHLDLFTALVDLGDNILDVAEGSTAFKIPTIHNDRQQLPKCFVLLLFEAFDNGAILSHLSFDLLMLRSEPRLVECEILYIGLVTARVMVSHSASTHFLFI